VTGIEAFSVLGAVSQVAPGVGLGTGVLPMQVRTPPLLAMAAASVQALAPDREVLIGVGVSSPVVAGDWHGAGYPERPLARMREFIALLRECLSGRVVTFAGDYYQVRRFRLGVELGERRPRRAGGNPASGDGTGGTRCRRQLTPLLTRAMPARGPPWPVLPRPGHARAAGTGDLAGITTMREGCPSATEEGMRPEHQHPSLAHLTSVAAIEGPGARFVSDAPCGCNPGGTHHKNMTQKRSRKTLKTVMTNCEVEKG
jgi:hypothetical protein